MAKFENIALLTFFLFIQVTWSESVAMKYSPIVEHILATVNPEAMPLPEPGTDPLKVSVTLNLINLLEVDKKNNQVEVVVWEVLNWQTTVLSWDPSKYNDVTKVRLHSKSIWTPDLTIYNSLHKPEVISPEIVVVSSDGTVTYVPSVRLRFSCDLQTVDSPSGANCTIKYGPWSYSGDVLMMISTPGTDGDNFDLSDYAGHPRYNILKTYSKKDVKKYACCPESYEDFKFTMTIRDGGH